jgi:nicotinamidase-related amidase
MANLVLVVDVVVGFMEPGRNLYAGDKARQIIPNIRRLIESEQANRSSVIFVCDTHDPDDLEFEMFPVHCVKGTDECEVVPELTRYRGDTLRKRRYSAFFETDLEHRLTELNPEKIVICGVCTDICVMHTAADARNRDYAVEVPVDCVASFDDDAHRYALQHMERILGVNIVEPASTEGA